MRGSALLAVALLALGACGPAESPRYMSAAQAAAAMRCEVQAMQASAGITNVVENEVVRQQAYGLCVQAWRLEQEAAAEQRALDLAAARQAEASREEARRRAESDCRGARNREACIRGVMTISPARASPASTLGAADVPAVNRGPATRDRPSYDW